MITGGNIQEIEVARGQTCRDHTGRMKSGERAATMGMTEDKRLSLFQLLL
jgi:hypothetical protein